MTTAAPADPAKLEGQLVHAVKDLERDIAQRERWIGHYATQAIAAGVSKRRLMQLTGYSFRRIERILADFKRWRGNFNA